MYRTIDLCAGIGGIRRGFEMTGRFETVLSAEIDKYACATYEHLFGENPFNDLSSREFLEKTKKVGYDVLLAGFPCQPFSRAGLQKGLKDEKSGSIFTHIAEIIRLTRPKAVFLENVDNLAYIDKGETFREIIRLLELELGYKVIGTKSSLGQLEFEPKSFIRNSKDFGIPQNRNRIYIIAFDKYLYENRIDMLPSHIPYHGDEIIYKDLEDLLEYGADEKYYLSSGYLDTLKAHRIREKEKDHGFGYQIVNIPPGEKHIANTIMATGGSGKERNLVIDVQPDIAGKQLPAKKSPLNDECIRMMTPREWGKLQGFINYAFVDEYGNDKFSFPPEISAAQQYKQFGNSVTIPVIKTMAEFMCHCFQLLETENNTMSKEIQKKTSVELSASLEKEVKRIQVGREVLNALRSEIRAIDKIGDANNERVEKLQIAQNVAEDLLDAEVNLGKIISELPEARGKRTDLKPASTPDEKLSKREAIAKIGLSGSTAQRFMEMAAHPEVIEKLKIETRESDEIISRSSVLRAISAAKKPYIVNNTHDAEWYTPSCYIESARKVMGDIDLDPASCSAANETVKASKYYSAREDGLLQEWYGKIWLNPPYSLVQKFTLKLLTSEIEQAIILVNNATETRWFRDLAEHAAAMVFHTGRLAFEKTGGEKSKPMQGQVFIYIGNEPDVFLEEFRQYGWGTKIDRQN